LRGALIRADYRPVCWFQYVNNTFLVWPHGPENLDDFNHLNSIYPNIHFTITTGLDNFLPFLGIDNIGKTGWFLGSHCIQDNDPHQPLTRVPNHSIIQWISILCLPLQNAEPEPSATRSLPGESISSIVFRLNGYNDKQIHRALYPPKKEEKPREIKLLWPFCPLLDPPSAASSGCYIAT
jgi:hypothetical protein